MAIIRVRYKFTLKYKGPRIAKWTQQREKQTQTMNTAWFQVLLRYNNKGYIYRQNFFFF